MWFLTGLSVSSWSFGLGMQPRSATVAEALFWQTVFIYGFGAIWIPIFYLHFATLLVQAKNPLFLIAGYIMTILFEWMSATGHFVGMAPNRYFRFYAANPSIAYGCFFIFFLLLVARAELLMWKAMHGASETERSQILEVFIGTSLGFLGGITTFLLVFGIPVYPFGVYWVWLYVLIVAHAIVKHQLMDIRIVVRKTLIGSIVTMCLLAVYLLIATQLVHVLEGWVGSAHFLSSAVAAAVVALMLQPVLNRVRAFMDRRFFGDWVREMSRGVVHEIKRPLAKISLPAELTLMDIQDLEAGKKSVKEISSAIKDRMNFIIDQTAEAGKTIEALREVSDEGRETVEDVDVLGLLKRCVASVEQSHGKESVAIHLEATQDGLSVQGQSKQLEIALGNLIKNAVEASATDPVVVRAQGENGQVLISVKDQGPGIKGKDIGRIFEPFFTTKGSKGIGLGLYLAQKIIHQHNGQITVKSEEGKGSEFFIRLRLKMS
jgi:signal transduction histidine kinase